MRGERERAVRRRDSHAPTLTSYGLTEFLRQKFLTIVWQGCSNYSYAKFTSELSYANFTFE